MGHVLTVADSAVAIAEQLIAGVDGVLGVRNELTWAFDDTAPAGSSREPRWPPATEATVPSVGSVAGGWGRVGGVCSRVWVPCCR